MTADKFKDPADDWVIALIIAALVVAIFLVKVLGA